jgi:hypothetical protein
MRSPVFRLYLPGWQMLYVTVDHVFIAHYSTEATSKLGGGQGFSSVIVGQLP